MRTKYRAFDGFEFHSGYFFSFCLLVEEADPIPAFEHRNCGFTWISIFVIRLPVHRCDSERRAPLPRGSSSLALWRGRALPTTSSSSANKNEYKVGLALLISSTSRHRDTHSVHWPSVIAGVVVQNASSVAEATIASAKREENVKKESNFCAKTNLIYVPTVATSAFTLFPFFFVAWSVAIRILRWEFALRSAASMRRWRMMLATVMMIVVVPFGQITLAVAIMRRHWSICLIVFLKRRRKED